MVGAQYAVKTERQVKPGNGFLFLCLCVGVCVQYFFGLLCFFKKESDE